MKPSETWTEFLKLAPRTIEVVDFEGKTRRFKLEGGEREHFGYDLFVREEAQQENGYYFKAFSHSSPHEALEKLINTVRSELSTRHLEPSSHSGPPTLMCDKARGRVVYCGVVIDGKLISWPDFMRMSSSYEGWEFSLKFTPCSTS